MLSIKENKKAINILRYIVKAFKYLGYTLIALFIMVLFTLLGGLFLGFTHSSLWFWLLALIAITILVFRLNTSQKLIIFSSLFVFYAVYIRILTLDRGCLLPEDEGKYLELITQQEILDELKLIKIRDSKEKNYLIR